MKRVCQTALWAAAMGLGVTQVNAKELRLLLPPVALSKNFEAEYASVLQSALLNEIQKGGAAQIYEVGACGDCQKVMESKGTDFVLKSEMARLGKSWTLSSKLYNKQGQVKFASFKISKTGEEGFIEELLAPTVQELNQNLLALQAQPSAAPRQEVSSVDESASKSAPLPAGGLTASLGAWNPGVVGLALASEARRQIKLQGPVAVLRVDESKAEPQGSGASLSFSPSQLLSWAPASLSGAEGLGADARRQYKSSAVKLGAASMASPSAGALASSVAQPKASVGVLASPSAAGSRSPWVKWGLYGVSALSATWAYYEQDKVWRAMSANKAMNEELSRSGDNYAYVLAAGSAIETNQSLMKSASTRRNLAAALSGLSFSTSLAFFTF